MEIFELNDFYDVRFWNAFRSYFQEIGVNLREDTDVFDDITESHERENMRTFAVGGETGLAGFIMVQPECLKGSFFEERVGFIRELWVSPAYRNRGYGRDLMNRVEAHFREMGISKLILTYEEEALPFYRKLGFVPDGSYQAKNEGNILIKPMIPGEIKPCIKTQNVL